MARAQQELTGLGTNTYGPKSEAAERTVPLPKSLMKEVGDHLDEFVATGPKAPVFTRPSGLPLRRADESRAWRDACEAVGITPWNGTAGHDGLRMHDLRHHARDDHRTKGDN